MSDSQFHNLHELFGADPDARSLKQFAEPEPLMENPVVSEAL